jgi:hypothetical protein
MQVGGFDVEQTDERLTLAPALGLGKILTGCGVLVAAFGCVLALGLLSILQESQMTGENLAPGANGGFTPHGNHFGLFWIVGSVVSLVLVPISVRILYNGAPAFVFDRGTGTLRRGKRDLARLGRIEAICVRRITPMEDNEERPLYHLLVLHGDGFEVPLSESHHNETLEVLAEQIARFVDRAVVHQTPPAGALRLR